MQLGWRQYTVYSTQYTVHSTQYTVYSIQYTVYSIQYTVHSTQYTVHSLQYTVYSIQHICIYIYTKLVHTDPMALQMAKYRQFSKFSRFHSSRSIDSFHSFPRRVCKFFCGATKLHVRNRDVDNLLTLQRIFAHVCCLVFVCVCSIKTTSLAGGCFV